MEFLQLWSTGYARCMLRQSEADPLLSCSVPTLYDKAQQRMHAEDTPVCTALNIETLSVTACDSYSHAIRWAPWHGCPQATALCGIMISFGIMIEVS